MSGILGRMRGAAALIVANLAALMTRVVAQSAAAPAGWAPAYMDARSLPELRQRLSALSERNVSIQNIADGEGRDLTADELAEVDQNFAEFTRVEAEISRRERMMANADRVAVATPRQTAGEAPRSAAGSDASRVAGSAGAAAVGGGLVIDAQGRQVQIVDASRPDRWGWNHLGEYASAVRRACAPGGGFMDKRLEFRMAPSTYGTEGTGEDGGFLVPPEFRTAIMEKVQAEDQLLSRTDTLQASGNAIVVPVDETTPWETSAGVQAYWEGEASQIPGSKPKFQDASVRLNKLTAMVVVTNELLEDAPALDGYLRRKAPIKINFKINRAIVAGNGVGQPLGIVNSGATVTVAAEGGQSADTIVFNNITKMWSRMYSGCWTNSIWLANQDALPQLLTMGFPTSATAVPVFIPPGGLADSPFGRLMGRPIVFTEACETIGDKGDILLVDLTQYMTALKVGGIRAETSMHLYFDYDMMAFRFILRVAGAPWWSSAITPRSGSSNTLSCFVALAAR